ncbi:alpha/beta hydrolase [Polymorphospora sp. NPDC051019]|uniref:alpha/beta hydrolase n=1 Tax=Polymorphospora sp. NPDC051019 TaxID=3155725 RepID=UPI0034210350
MTRARPPYDPELQKILDTVLADPPPPLDAETLPGVRARAAAMYTPIGVVIEGTGLEHVEMTAPGTAGAPDVTLSVVRRPGRGEPAPCIYHVHGGGMVAGNRHLGARAFPRWVERFGVTVVSVEHRLAPEHPHPAPVEDCYTGLCWIVDHAAEIGIDASRIIIAGGSSGGGLAAGTALMARDRGGPGLIGQLLMCPMLDDRDATTSTRQYDGAGLWSRADNLFGWTALLGTARGGADVPPYAAPARAADLGGLPPAYLDAGSAEVFRDEVVDYASRIWAAGGQAELHIWAGGFHGFAMMAGHTEVARLAQAAVDSWLTRLLGAGEYGY